MIKVLADTKMGVGISVKLRGCSKTPFLITKLSEKRENNYGEPQIRRFSITFLGYI